MEEYIVGHDNLPKPSLFQMNSSNILNNMASLEGFNMSFQEIMSYDDDHMLGSNASVFDHVMPHFFPEIAVNSSPSTSGTIGFLDPHKINKKHQEENQSGKKRKRSNERETQKEKEVVHVRAKRGQATDSHSLAERLRREKINDKLRCLQDLVPGCYKTMGMAVMLDVIINYVRSLQDQIDFLSMKLSAASLFYDFNSSEAEAMEALQGTSGYEGGQVMEKVVGDGYGEIPQFQSAAWPL